MKSSTKLSDRVDPEILEKLKMIGKSENKLNTVNDVLYHGTSQIYVGDLTNIANINPLRNKNFARDFAAGFYLTSSAIQAYNQGRNKQDFIKRKVEFESKKKHGRPVQGDEHKPLVIAYNVDKEKLEYYFKKSPEKKYLFFDESYLHDEWCGFILNNRIGKGYTDIWQGKLNNLCQEFSLVQGPLADGKIGAAVIEYQNTTSEDERDQVFSVFKQEISKDFSFGKGNQISFHDKKLIQEVLTFKEIVNTKETEEN